MLLCWQVWWLVPFQVTFGSRLASGEWTRKPFGFGLSRIQKPGGEEFSQWIIKRRMKDLKIIASKLSLIMATIEFMETWNTFCFASIAHIGSILQTYYKHNINITQ